MSLPSEDSIKSILHVPEPHDNLIQEWISIGRGNTEADGIHDGDSYFEQCVRAAAVKEGAKFLLSQGRTVPSLGELQKDYDMWLVKAKDAKDTYHDASVIPDQIARRIITTGKVRHYGNS